MVTRRKEGSRKIHLVFIGFALASILMLVAISYLPRLDTRGTLPPFEEINTHSEQLLDCIGRIDRAILDGFYEMGVSREKVVFLSLLPAQKDGYRWDFNTIEVRIPRTYEIINACEEIRKRITALNMAVRVAVERKSGDEVICHVYCRRFHTHQLKLAYETPIPAHRKASPKIAIIIDDLGYDSSLAKEFIELDLALTLSILPFTPYTRPIARRSRAKGREVMLHLPMEPKSYPRINPGDGVLLVSMERDTILKVLDRDLSEIPFVAGVNNHMGSRFTENKEKMMVVLAELKRRGLFFVDSKTSRHTVAFDIAKQIEIRAARRDVFLDNDLSEDALRMQMDRLLTLARHKGHAIGIGHPHKETLWFLRGLQMTLTKEAEVVPVSRLVSH